MPSLPACSLPGSQLPPLVLFQVPVAERSCHPPLLSSPYCSRRDPEGPPFLPPYLPSGPRLCPTLIPTVRLSTMAPGARPTMQGGLAVCLKVALVYLTGLEGGALEQGSWLWMEPVGGEARPGAGLTHKVTGIQAPRPWLTALTCPGY